MEMNLNQEQLAGILEVLPAEISFVDADDRVRFWNKHETRVFKRPLSAIGKNVQDCHPQKSLDLVNQVITDLKSGKRDFTEFWIDTGGRKLHIKYFAVRSTGGKYLGTLEFNQDITDIKRIVGEKRQLEP